MSEKYKVIDKSIATFVTITVTDWVDLFVRRAYTDVVDESLNYCIENKGLKVHAYVYMTSHIHLVASSDGDDLQNIIRDFKKHTSKKLIETIIEIPESRREWLLAKFKFAANRIKRGVNYKLWKDGFHPILLDNGEKIVQRINYIHQNPIDAGFVYQEDQWKNSSFNIYAENDGEIPNVQISKLF